MSLISMILMELAMNLTDFAIMGEPAMLVIIPFTLGAGFLAAWPYNYWKLKKNGVMLSLDVSIATPVFFSLIFGWIPF